MLSGPQPAALTALFVANVALTFGPSFVRIAVPARCVGLLAVTLTAPFCSAGRSRPDRDRSGLGGAVVDAREFGYLLAADFGSSHLGILWTTLADAALFGDSATLMFPIYGFLIARAWPTRTQGGALLLALVGAVLLMGRSYRLDRGISG